MQEQPSPTRQHPFQFTGSGSEYFRIWIVNIFLTVFTLYIYSAWAKVRTRRYFYGNTVLDGSSFEYHATGRQLLPGRLIGLTLVALIAVGNQLYVGMAAAGYLLLAILAPWALCQSRQFNARMSSYRNVHFNFSGTPAKFYEYMVLMPFIPVLIIGTLAAALYFSRVVDQTQLLFATPVALLAVYAMSPWIMGKLAHYALNNSQYGTAEFSADITAGRVAAIYYKGIALSIGLMALLLAIVAGVITLLTRSEMLDTQALANPQSSAMWIMMGLFYLFLIPVSTLIKAFIESRARNYQLNNTTLDRKFKLSSNITTAKLWGLEITNLLLIVLTLGLGYPWAAVRKARFMVSHTSVITKHNADHFVTQQAQYITAMGDELGDVLDLDIAAGF